MPSALSRRRPLQCSRGRHRRRLLREGAHQPRQLCRPGTHIQEALLHRRGVCRRDKEDRIALRPLPQHLQAPPHSHPHRRQPRLPERPHHVTLRRHTRRHGRVVHGVPAHLRQGAVHRCRHLHQGQQHRRHGAHSAPSRRADGQRVHGLSPPSRRHRGRRGRRRTHQKRCRHRSAPLRRHRRHHPRVTLRSPRT